MSEAAALLERPDAALAAALVAIDPWRFGGVVVRARAGPARDGWLAHLRALLGPDQPLRRLPLHADDSRIGGGLDLAATLAAGRPVAERGLLAETDGGVLVVPMAERMTSALAARLGTMLDGGTVGSFPARVGLVALDEGIEEDERLPAALAERLAFWIELTGDDPVDASPLDAATLRRARVLYPAVGAGDAILDALAGTAAALGVDSLRAAVLALRVARAAAALDGCRAVATEHAAIAARLVLAPRATRLPVAPPEPAEAPPPDETAPGPPEAAAEASSSERSEPAPDDIVLAAAKAALPAGLLDRLRVEGLLRARGAAAGVAGARQITLRRGRPAGVRRGKPEGGARLDLCATLRAAAPWQALRHHPTAPEASVRRLAIRSGDLRVTRFEQRTQTTTVFVVDASGSLAANRLAEAKGAVELLLADCYVRRDEVALISFRGERADLLLPPTRSLARAKRSLADLPGGGASPLATAIETAMALADRTRRRGRTAVVVLLTDGRANIARDGTPGRARATEDALAAAARAAASGTRVLLIDAAPRPQPPAQALAAALRADYLPLPRADAAAVSHAVRAATAGRPRPEPARVPPH